MSNTQQLEQVRSLSREITAALSAIERNDLQAFQQAIASQERICNQLALTDQPAVAGSGSEGLAVYQAYVELAQVNRLYAAVIKRSKRCADVLLSLYGGCDARYVSGEHAQIDREGLACEA
jgi:hypothetical protein